jgi:hypothetical protein
MRIALDLDNTIIDYDEAFVRAAEAEGLIRPGEASGKSALLRLIWSRGGGDLDWQRLQARVYGPDIGLARMADGFDAFLARALRQGAELHVISHKSRTAAAAPDGTDLREAARAWLDACGIIGPGALAHERVLFADTREDKVAAIRRLECAILVDDLIEVLNHPALPSYVRRLHYAPQGDGPEPGVETCRSWAEVSARIFG